MFWGSVFPRLVWGIITLMLHLVIYGRQIGWIILPKVRCSGHASAPQLNSIEYLFQPNSVDISFFHTLYLYADPLHPSGQSVAVFARVKFCPFGFLKQIHHCFLPLAYFLLLIFLTTQKHLSNKNLYGALSFALLLRILPKLCFGNIKNDFQYSLTCALIE